MSDLWLYLWLGPFSNEAERREFVPATDKIRSYLDVFPNSLIEA